MFRKTIKLSNLDEIKKENLKKFRLPPLFAVDCFIICVKFYLL